MSIRQSCARGLKRLAAATAILLPLATWAATTTGYNDFGDTAGVVLWRGAGTMFHTDKVIDVDAEGNLGVEYAMTADNGATSWQRFASNQQAYSVPGKVLVYDQAGCAVSTDAQFAPLSFGGLWVKVLQAADTPYTITDNKTDATDRTVELGAADAATLFKFDASFKFNRNSPVQVLGTATFDIANGATFTINERAGKGAQVDSGATMKLTGAGTLAVTGGLTVDGTLDLSAATRPTISGDVTLFGTLVLPAGTVISAESPFQVCSGSLSGVNAFIKIGDAEAVEYSMTISGGAIAALGEPVYEFTENFPTTVPAGKTYTFVGGASGTRR